MSDSPAKLRKELGLIEVFCITSGAMMSSGLFILPGMAYAQAGPAVVAAYLLAAVLAATGMLSQAELATAMPKSGGTYFYVMRSMGSAVGTVYGLITFLALALKSSFELIGMAAFTSMVVDIDIRLIAGALCAVFIALNILGAKEAGRIQIVFVIIIISALAAYVGMGFPEVRFSRFEPFHFGGAMSVFSAAGFVFVSYGGLLKIASIAEEVKNPGRTLPLGMILSLLVVVVVYLLVILVTVGVVPAADLKQTLTPVSDGAALFMGQWGKIALGITAVIAFTSATNAGIMGASRYPLALSRDELLPKFLGDINERFKTPHWAVLVTGVFMIAALFLDLKVIVKAASCVLILTYVFSCLAVIIMRESGLQNYMPAFRAPLYPWIQIVGMAGFILLLTQLGAGALLTSLGLIFGGLLVYWFYGRIRARKEYALMHIIERITARALTTHSLETELKDILHERDEVTKDRFDRLVEDAPVLDLEGPLSSEEFFHQAAKQISPRLGIAEPQLVELLLAREDDSSTVISPGLAIPHVIVEGDHRFDLLLARIKSGVDFPDESSEVHAVFVLIGSKDERNFHLRALSAIAQIVMDPNFEKMWMSAKNEEGLRDIMLLCKRRRH